MDHEEACKKIREMEKNLLRLREEWGREKFMAILGGYLLEECFHSGMDRTHFNSYLDIMQNNFDRGLTALRR